MVGGFSVTISLLTLSLIGNSQQSETTCPAICMCLGDSVDCSHKGYSTLPSDIPNWTTKLNLNNNRIHSLDSGILNNLLNVKDLKLNRNKITHLFKDAFTNQKKLDILELNRNQLEDIEPLSFQYLEKLSSLKLRRNRIKHLLDGTFFGLTAIGILELDFNLLSTVTKGWLYGLDHLRVLSLSNNVITQIESDVWDFCKELIDLNLSSNQLGSVQKGTFKHLSQLERLNLNNNKIAHIEEGAFLNTPKLKILWLNNNKLSWTVEDVNRAFSGLADLEKFHLASNQIKSISKNAFIELRNIITLDLSNNNITTLQNNSFSELTNLKELFLNTSTLVCDCNLQWLADWLRRGNFSKIKAMCAYPLWLREKNIRDVVNFTCDDVPKPRLIEEPKMKMALKGENVSLFCKAVSSSPGAMTFLWKRDNIELHDAAIRETASSPDGRHTEHTSELRLYNIAHTDQGKYQCVVANSYGTTYSQKTRISVLIFPKFSKTPANLTVRAGDTARLECAAQGEPHPQIAWQKDGGNDFPAARERRMHVMPTDDVFFIVNVKTVDMGVYSCTAQNAAGVMIANATLAVLEIPTFVKPMENKEITAGEPIVLECMAGGSPRPTLTWLKDGGPLKATERHFFTAEDQLMVIVGTTLSDAGRYECLMNNSLGTERGYSELSIIPGTSVNEDDMMGIIIITVVCCAVGTSVIWVVIIYQTRKRINNSASTSVTAMTDGAGAGDTRVYVEISSEQSSCKDSGTGDSAKLANLSDNFTLLSDGSNQQQQQPRMVTVNTSTPAVFINNSHAPLLQSQHGCPRSTNHDRRQDDDISEVVTKNFD